MPSKAAAYLATLRMPALLRATEADEPQRQLRTAGRDAHAI
jgi:hypothetical protein